MILEFSPSLQIPPPPRHALRRCRCASWPIAHFSRCSAIGAPSFAAAPLTIGREIYVASFFITPQLTHAYARGAREDDIDMRRHCRDKSVDKACTQAVTRKHATGRRAAICRTLTSRQGSRRRARASVSAFRPARARATPIGIFRRLASTPGDSRELRPRPTSGARAPSPARPCPGARLAALTSRAAAIFLAPSPPPAELL